MKMNKLTTLAVMMTLALGITACNDDKNVAVKPTVAAAEQTTVMPASESTTTTSEVKVDTVAPVKAVQVIESKPKEAPKKEVKAASGAQPLKIDQTVNGETSYIGTTTVSGTLEYNRTDNEELCEICFYFDEESTKLIPKPIPDDNRPAIAIRYDESEILGLSVNENECMSVPMTLEVTDYIGVTGGNYGLARILKATKTGDAKIESCS